MATPEALAASLVGVHEPSACEGHGCWVHHPSEHHMKDWPVVWRTGKGVIERICPHGVGHPDPDDMAFIERSYGKATADTMSVHGCDGCCRSEHQMRMDTGIEWSVGSSSP